MTYTHTSNNIPFVTIKLRSFCFMHFAVVETNSSGHKISLAL